MSRKLTDEQVTLRLQEGRNYKHLYFELKDKYDSAQNRIKVLEAKLQDRDDEMSGLKSDVVTLKDQVQRLTDSKAKYRFYLFKDTKPAHAGATRRAARRSPASYIRPAPSEAEITDRQELALVTCPHCEDLVSPSVESYTTYVEDIVFAPKRVTEYTIHRHWCRGCNKLVRAAVPDALPGMSLGLNTVLYVLVEHYRAKKTDEQIVESLERYFQLSVSSGEITAIRHQAAHYFADSYRAIVDSIRTAAVIYGDETGWYVQGSRHGQCWILTAPEVPAVLFKLANTRAKDELQSLLGDSFEGVMVSDFYSVYDGVGSEQQKCWVHLLRDSHLSARASPENQERQALHQALTKTYHRITAFRAKHWNKLRAGLVAKKLDKRLLKFANRDWQDAQCKRLAKRIRKYHRQLLTCVRHPDVLPENNTAERGLRPVVVQRKITSGNRSAKGARTYEVNMSVITTMRAESGDLLTKLRNRLWQAAWGQRLGAASLE